MKYTPGPWVREIMPAPSGKMLDYIHTTYTDGRAADEIAAITSENYADANLIAAAPDLYEALERLVKANATARLAHEAWLAMDDLASDEEIDYYADANEDAQATLVIRENEARAALAKARGTPQ